MSIIQGNLTARWHHVWILPWPSWTIRNFFLKCSTALFALMVAIPDRDSLNIAKIGERASPSAQWKAKKDRWEYVDSRRNRCSMVLLPNRFSSLDVVTNILRTRKKYQTNGGTNTNVTGCFRIEQILDIEYKSKESLQNPTHKHSYSRYQSP